ncbi:MAG: hypothetical protein ABF633_01680 [Clostridium sp.]|uniref:hypothetical protein n=1 Tax=Clostridium sp. TaxID=1506 RepID=UPI0039EC0B5D
MKDMNMVVELDNKIKEEMSKKLDDLLKEMKRHEVKSSEDMLERNEKIMSVLNYETECINKLIELYEDKMGDK